MLAYLLRIKRFQFTPLHERQRRSGRGTVWCSTYFNSRLYMRGSTECPQTGITACNFNSRLYMRGSPAIQPRISILSLFQFTPLHERQLGETVGKRKKSIISIHASTWEAAVAQPHFQAIVFNFNSRLYMRGSLSVLHGAVNQVYFNSRLYMRGSASSYFGYRWRNDFNSRLYMRGSVFPPPAAPP